MLFRSFSTHIHIYSDTVNLPSTDIFGDHSVRPVIVEARGGSK